MSQKTYDVVGLGNAIVDILAYKDTAFLEEHDLPIGGMTLIDEARAHQIFKGMGATTDCSGGSAANTLAGIGMLGGSGAFIGRVKDDNFGEIFKRQLQKTGIEFTTPRAESGPTTAQCLIMVTEEESTIAGAPKKVERTMATYLGASIHVSKEDVDADLIARSKVLYFEGYLWDSPSAKEAIHYAITIAKENDTKVAFSLSDMFCVERHHAEFVDLIDNSVDILFGNEHEIEHLTGESDIKAILGRVNGMCETVCVTRSDKGSYILTGGEIHSINPVRVEEVFDVTGAGDLYAAGFLYGYVNNLGAEKSGRLASRCASEVIKYLGGRPATALAPLKEQL